MEGKRRGKGKDYKRKEIFAEERGSMIQDILELRYERHNRGSFFIAPTI